MAKKKVGTWYKIKQIFWRMIATFTANGLATIGAGSLVIRDVESDRLVYGVPTHKEII